MAFLYDKDYFQSERDESHINPSKHAMTISVYIPALTEEEIDASRKQIYEEMKSYRARSEKARRDSIETAKKTYIK